MLVVGRDAPVVAALEPIEQERERRRLVRAREEARPRLAAGDGARVRVELVLRRLRAARGRAGVGVGGKGERARETSRVTPNARPRKTHADGTLARDPYLYLSRYALMKRSSGSLTRSSRRNLCSHVVNALCSDKPLHWWSRSAPHFDCGVGRQTSFPPACFRQHRRAGCQPDGRALAHGTQSATGCCVHPVIASNSATNAREPTPGSSHMSRRWRGASISRGERRSGASVALRAATARSLAPRRTAGTLGGRPAASFGVSGVGLAVATHKSAKRRMLACADGVERRCRRRVLNPPPAR